MTRCCAAWIWCDIQQGGVTCDQLSSVWGEVGVECPVELSLKLGSVLSVDELIDTLMDDIRLGRKGKFVTVSN